MKRALSIFSTTVIALTILSVFGWMVKHRTLKDKDFGFLNKPVEEVSSFFDLFKKTVKEVQTLPGTFVRTQSDYKEINQLENDVYALVTYTNDKNNRSIEVLNLKTEESWHSWEIVPAENIQAHDRIVEPLLFSDKSLAYSFTGATGLIKVDSTGNRLWSQDSIIHHHSLNFDHENNIWACAHLREPQRYIPYKGSYWNDGHEVQFIDDAMALIDGETGEVLFTKSILELLIENGLEHFLLRAGNSEDPIHINDVQPVLYDSDYFKKGDVFLSFRNLYCLIHYRPQTNELVDIIEGPFTCQHDVDIYSDSLISIFNNNTHFQKGSHKRKVRQALEPIEMGNFWSEIIFYNLKTGEFQIFGDSVFASNGIFTFTEGLHEFIDPTTVFIEEQNSGELWILNEEGVIYKNVLNSHHENHHHLSNWTRIVKIDN